MRIIIAALFFLILQISCKKEDSIDEITYEVTLINAFKWHGTYLNEKAEVISITNAPSNWRYIFKNKNGLVTAVISSYPDGTNNNIDAIMKIYLNGNLVAEGRSSISPQVWYNF